MSMDLFKVMNISPAEEIVPLYNTGHPIDLLSSNWLPGIDGSMINNGGLGFQNGIVAWPNRQKTATLVGMTLGCLLRYPGSNAFINESENTLDKRRIWDLSPSELTEAEKTDLNDRVKLKDVSTSSIEEIFEDVEAIAEAKKKHAKEFTVELPMLDPTTGKPFRSLVPTIYGIDSLTMMYSKVVDEALNSAGITDSSNNTADMIEAKAKGRFLTQLNKIAKEANIRFIVTGHINTTKEMNRFSQSVKNQPHMKHGEKIIKVGPSFGYLSAWVLNIFGLEELEIDKATMYPLDNTTKADLSYLSAVIIRNKYGQSGTQLNTVNSQTYGYLPALSDYHVLKTHDRYGLGGNNIHVSNVLMPDETYTRQSVRKKLRDNYRLRRSFEILRQMYQLRFMRTFSGKEAEWFATTPEQFVEKVARSNSIKMDDILESRGYWTYDTQNKRKYLSIHDIFRILEK